MKRRGCSKCGMFVMSLDQARYTLQKAVGEYDRNPTPAIKKKAERAREAFSNAKKMHDEHMNEH